MSPEPAQSEGPARSEPAVTERRHAAILFCDILGFTALSERLGVEAAYDHVTECLMQLDAVAREHGGAIDKYLGDALMVVFGHPIPNDDAVASALRAAVAMHAAVEAFNREKRLEAPLAVHSGVQASDVLFGRVQGHVIREFHVLGDAVNVAARLKERAPRGAIYVAAGASTSVPDGCRLRPLEAMRLKGKQQTVETFELEVLRPPAAAGLRVAPGAAPFVGRASELARVRAFVTQPRARSAWLALLGPRGAGKTRLVAEALRGDVPQLAIAGRAREPIGELVARWRRELGAALPGRAASGATEGMAVAHALIGRRAREPLLLVVDDLPLVEPDVHVMLRELAERHDEHAISLLTTARRHAGAVDELVGAHPGLEVVELPPLSEREARQLLDQTVELPPARLRDEPELARRMLARAQGWPGRILTAARAAPLLAEALRAETAAASSPGALIERSEEAERRRACVLFADITGFTALTERLPPGEAYAAVKGCLDVLDTTAREFGGSVEKHLGDCVLALFGVPAAIEDAPRAAVNAAIEMRRRVRDYDQTLPDDVHIDVHIGIETGLGIAGGIGGDVRREFAVMGDPVNRASQLCDRAPAGQIWIGDETRKQLHGVFPLVTPAEPDAAPSQGRAQAQRVDAERPVLHREAHPLAAAGFARMIGRRREREQLCERLEALRRGEGSAISLVGDAGIGKSRLVQELRELALEQGLDAWTGRALSVGQNQSYHVFADLLRSWAGIGDEVDDEALAAHFRAALGRVLGEEAAALGPFLSRIAGVPLRAEEAARLGAMDGDALGRLLVGALRRWLEAVAERAPVAIIFEDVHWADQSSFQLIEALLASVATSPVMVVGVTRPARVGATIPLLEVAQEAAGSRHDSIELAPLDDADVKRLIDESFGRGEFPWAVRERITERAAGNPLFVQEVLRSLFDDGVLRLRDGVLVAAAGAAEAVIPGTVQEVMMARVDRRPLAQRRLLQAAAVIGQSFHGAVIECVCRELAIEPALDTLIEQSFLAPVDRLQGIEFGFEHPLMQEVIYDSLVGARKSELHEVVGRAIESVLPTSVPGYLAMLAYHFSLGRSTDRAEEYLIEAGAEAAEGAASNEALSFFREASRLYFERHGEEGDPARKALLARHLGVALYQRGELEDAIAALTQALEHHGVRRSSRPWPRRLRFVRNFVSVMVRDQLARWGLPRREATREEQEIVELFYRRGTAQATRDPEGLLFDSIEGVRWLVRVDPGSVPLAEEVYAGGTNIFSFGGLSFAVGERFLDMSRAAMERGRRGEATIYFRMSCFVHHYLKGEWRKEFDIDPAELEQHIKGGELFEVTNYLGLVAERAIWRGDFDEAEAILDQVVRIWDLYQHKDAKTNSYWLPTFLLLEKRRLEESLEAADAYYAENPEEMIRLAALSSRSLALTLLGRLDESEEALALAEGIVEKNQPMLPFYDSAPARARLAADVARFEADRAAGRGIAKPSLRRARKHARRALRAAEKAAFRRPEVWRIHGKLEAVAGRAGAARRWWTRAIDEATRLGMRPELGRVHAELARHLAGTQERVAGLDAAGHRAEAARLFEALGLDWDLAGLAGHVPASSEGRLADDVRA